MAKNVRKLFSQFGWKRKKILRPFQAGKIIFRNFIPLC